MIHYQARERLGALCSRTAGPHLATVIEEVTCPKCRRHWTRHYRPIDVGQRWRNGSGRRHVRLGVVVEVDMPYVVLEGENGRPMRTTGFELRRHWTPDEEDATG